MHRSLVLLAAAAIVSGPAFAQPAAKPVHRFHEVTDGVYSAIATGAMTVGSNSAIIVNEKEVLVVDSHITPASARALIQELKTITDKPVRYVVNTHYHFDHAHGNQVFPDDVLVIGHDFTRQKLLGDVLNERTYKSFTSGVPGQIEGLKKQLAAEADAAKRQELQDRIEVTQAYLTALQEVKPSPPNVTFRSKLTLFRGGREIQLLFFGRGHTGGDVVVYLPQEKIVCTGDLFSAGINYMGDGYVDEWAATLEELKRLDFTTVIPGHGEVFTGKERIDFVQAYLRELWTRALELKSQGVPAEQAAKRIDMTSHKARFPQIQSAGVDPRAVLRIYELSDERARR